jgi:ribosomal protein L40E
MKICPKCQAEHSLNGKFCSPKCANSRVRTQEIKDKISESILSTYAKNGSKCKGKPGWKHSDADKDKKRQLTLEYWDKRGRILRSEDDLKTINKMRVGQYRARKYNATPADADKKLISKIYKACPEGYEVDHILALAEGGLHHESNLQYLPAMENRRKNKSSNYDLSLVIKWQDVLK